MPWGFFFIHLYGYPVTRYKTESVSNNVICVVGLDTKIYQTHYFRIGAATSALVSEMRQKDTSGKGL